MDLSPSMAASVALGDRADTKIKSRTEQQDQREKKGRQETRKYQRGTNGARKKARRQEGHEADMSVE